ncbi:MAG: sialate O-acetylesterase [Verrucomicrobiota bacterium]
MQPTSVLFPFLRSTTLTLGVLAAMLAGLAPRVSAKLIVGEEQYNAGLGQTGPPSPINCVSGDLLEMPGVSVAGSEIAGLRNGPYAATIGYNESPFTLTYTLAPNATGYDIKEIRVFSGWDFLRSLQSYDILYSLIDAPDTFLSLGTVLTPAGQDGVVMTRTYDSSAGASPDAGSGILTLSRVAKIRFNIRPNGFGAVLHEIDVTGSATSSSPQKNLTSFTFPTYGAASSVGTAISMSVPYGTALSALVPTYSLSYGATCVPASGSTQNFSSPVQYTVTASDHTTQTYTVTVAPRSIPDPVFTLVASANPWDGRQTMTVTPNISNWSALQAAGGTNLTYNWSVAGLAVSKQITPPTSSLPGSLTLLRSQGSGPLTVTLTLDNGGWPITRTVTINVQQPTTDAWVQRTPAADEKPVTGQFFARDDTGFGTIYYNGTQAAAAVYLKVYTTETGTDVPYGEIHRQVLTNGTYAFSVPIAAGLFKYKVEFGTTSGSTDIPLASVTNLICGDAYIVDGQSNSVADVADNPYSSDWIRSFGDMTGGTSSGWGNAVRGSNMGNAYRIGYWAMDIAIDLVATYHVPICIINGAVGGTRIDQHQANPADHYAAGSLYSIYASLLTRVAAAKLTHGIRGILWHQGENDSGLGAPTSDWDYQSYQQYFIDMAAAWIQDYPNVKHYYVYQVWPKPCSMGPKDDQVREVQRTLPRLFSNMSVMSTIGVTEAWSYGTVGLCHFDWQGYTQLAALMAPLVEQYSYGTQPITVITPPNLRRASFTNSAKTAIALEFDQDVQWNATSTSNIYLDGLAGLVASGSVSGHVVTLQLSAASTATTITYLKGSTWDGSSSTLLRGTNNIAALTFADVAIGLASPTGLSATPNNIQVALAWTASAGATGYKVKRSLTTGGPYAVIATPSATTYTDTEVTNNNTYFYVVSSNDGITDSADSLEASATIKFIGSGVSSTTLVRHANTGSSSTYGDTLSFDVTVSGSTTPTGNVTLKDGGVGGTTLGSATLAAGACTISSTALTVGSHTNIVAVYSGDGNFAASTSSALSTQTVSAVLSSAKDFLTFGANVAGSSAVINTSAATIAWTVPFGTAVTTLAPTYTLSALANGSPASGSSHDFTTSQNYTNTAENGTTKVYTVTVTVAAASSAKDFLTFGTNVAGSSAIINTSAATIAWTVPSGTSLASLAPTYTLSALANGSPASGTTRSFSTAQTYTNTAQDGTTKVYSVTTTVAAPTNNGPAYYFDVNGTTAGFGAPSGSYNLSGSYWSTDSTGQTAPATVPSSSQLTFGNAGSDLAGNTFTISLDNGNGIYGILVNSTSANITLTGTQNNNPTNNSTWTVAAGSTLNQSNTYVSSNPGMNWNSAAVTLAGGGTINFNKMLGFNSGSTTAGAGMITENDAGLGLVVNLNKGSTPDGGAPYTTGFTLTSGTLNFATTASADAFKGFSQATKPFSINGGTVDNTSASAMTLTVGSAGYSIGGNFTFTGSSDLNFGSTKVVLTGSRQITVASHTLTIGGVISGSGYGLTKAGSGTLALTGVNTYSGATTVNAGTLSLGNGTTNSALVDAAGVVIGASGTLSLNFSIANSDTVNTLTIAGVQKSPGVWGAIGSGAAHTDSHLTGAGTLTVATGPNVSTYDTWAAAQTPPLIGGPGTVGRDGLSNLLVYALALKTHGGNGSPGTLAGKALTFTKRAEAVTNNDVTYSIQTSADLGASSPWTTVSTGVTDTPTSITYSLPASQGMIFARLVVSQK